MHPDLGTREPLGEVSRPSGMIQVDVGDGEHRDIVDAIALGDAVTAERVARIHIAKARDAYVELPK